MTTTLLSGLVVPMSVADASTPPPEPPATEPATTPTEPATTPTEPAPTPPNTESPPATTAAAATTTSPPSSLPPTSTGTDPAPTTDASAPPSEPVDSTPPATTIASPADAPLVSGVPASDVAFGAASVPGLPGTPQPPVLVFADDFEVGQPVSASGIVASYGDAIAPNGWPGTAEEWNVVRTLADVLGQWGGVTQSQGNHVVTPVPGGAGSAVVATAPVSVEPGHYYTVAADFASANCAGAPRFDLSLVADGTQLPASSTAVDVCARPAVVAGDIAVGTALGDVAVMAPGGSLQIVVSASPGGAGVGALDNLRLVDVTPQLDLELGASDDAAAGDVVPLTFTVTNTTELGSKSGWSFTATLPAGLTVAEPVAGTDGIAVTAEVGSNIVEAHGELVAGATSATFTVAVVADDEGTYALGPDNVETIGLHAPGESEVTFGPATEDVPATTADVPPTTTEDVPTTTEDVPATTEDVPPAADDGLFAPLALAGPPEYEIAGDWITPPAEVASGDPVVAQWYVNVNDSADPPGNDPVDDVTATFTVGNGRFEGIPDACLTTGVTPASSISTDGLTLTCNFGTVNAGSAVAVQTPVTANGPTGSELSIEGSIAGQTVTPDPIPIVNTFGMDIAWQGATNFREYGTGYVDVDLEWTLFLQDFSEAGPDSVTYELTVTDGIAAGLVVGPNACTPFTDGPAGGHPWSGGTHPTEQMAPFVDSCTLTQIDADTFELTLTGIDYSLAQVPTTDSADQLLPVDRSAIASGSVWFRIQSAANNSITLVSNAPTYTSVSGATASDDPDNNRSDKTITRGGWSNAWRPETMGVSAPSWWSNQLYVSAGAPVDMVNVHQLGTEPRDPTDIISQCIIMDTRWVTYQEHYLRGRWGGTPIPDATIEYYVGGAATVDPGSAGYDPNAFTCATDPGGWTTTLPADLSTVKAVRASYPHSSISGLPLGLLNVRATLNDDAPVGQDVWQFGELAIDGVWQRPSRTLSPTDGGGPRTPGMRYPYIGSGRDVLYVVGVTPSIEKSVDRPTVLPGQPATFTLTYAANGTGAIAPTVDDFEIVDTLPEGMTYVDGSATPAPTSVATNPDGQQVLTWNLDGVPTNTLQTLTYQAGPDADVAGGTRLTNSAVASVDDQSTRPTTATVTTSTNGRTAIVKTATDEQVQITDETGAVTLPWTVTISSFDPVAQAFTDTIDILPYNGDGRGTQFSGDHALGEVATPDGGTVYYATADPTTLSDDPADASNGAAGDPAGNTVGWTTTPPADLGDVTAIRVIGPELAPGATFEFQLELETSGAEPGDVYVNRAQARSENTVLVMRTSALIELYEDVLVKELDSLVRNDDGTFDVVFTISNTRTGSGPGYDLSDTLQYGDGVTLNGDPVAANVDPGDGSITLVNTYDAATTTLTIADDVPIADGVTHVYTVTSNVTLDEATATFESTDCALEGGETGTGLLNTAALTVEDVDLEAEACAELPYTTHDKELTAGPTPNGDGTYTVEYTIDVHSMGAAPDVYDLSDEFMFGESVTIEGTPTVTNTEPGDIATLGTWDPAATTLAVVDGQPIPAGTADGPTTHSYVVTAVVSLDADTVTFENTDCEMGGDDGTGLFNESTLTLGGYVENDDACAPISEPLHAKTVTGGPTPIGNGLYEVEYTIEVTNTGAADSEYDLVDDFQFGESVTIEGTPTVVNTVPGGIATLGSWNPTATTLAIVDGEPIAAGAPGAPEVHAYVVTVQVSVDAETVTFEDTDCALADSETGTGLFNRATLDVNGEEADRDACPPISEPLHTKTITAGPELLGNGNYSVEFTIEVTNAGAAASTYDLVDDFRFSNAVTIEGTPTVTNSEPGGIPTLGTWDADTTTLVIVDDQPITAGAPDAPTVHAYVVSVEVSVDPALVTAANSDCELGTDDGTGLFNTATMTVNDEEADADTCTPFPSPEITLVKDIASGPTDLGDNRYEISYSITVSNDGTGAGSYDLDDRFRFGDGITVESAAIANTEPGGIVTDPSWNGEDEIVVVTAEELAAGSQHVYLVTAVVLVDAAGDATAEARDCTLTTGESGTGLLNTATVRANGDELTDDACAETPGDPELTVSKVVSATTVQPNGTLTYTVTVTNSGNVDFTEADPAVAVDDLTDVLDDATWLDTASASSGSLSFTAPTLTWSGPLAVGETVTMTYSVRVHQVVTGPGELHNTVSAVLSNCAPDTVDPECNTVTRIPPPAAPPAPITPGPIPVTG
ncbi:hypothetical protein [Desertimonas flava]|uniref:DUF7927 domain-containing protein n=1 Tax=Desertimonas flava TaxID=2064846 RepID=UPI0023F23170|nr:hypothetical protein [Desertimonas flava]